MEEIDLHKEYDSSGENLQDLFRRAEEGFFVPLYQREYTWEEDNINQLFDDLVLGVCELSEKEKVITFLGTTILTTLADKKQTVKPGEKRAQPTAVQIVIDGQQRISTLALISIQIIVRLQELLKDLPHKPPYSDLCDAGNKFIERLTKLYAIELGGSADPPQKPKIIRARDDLWTYDGDDTAYASPVAKYVATFIRTKDSEKALSILNPVTGIRVQKNVELINEWVDAVCNAHITGTNMYDQFPIGMKITSGQIQEYILGFTDRKVKRVVEKMEADKSRNDYCATATYQLLLLTYYLLNRCVINRLQPTYEEWGFDMFQALNATGTPLTVIETFLPQVMQAEVANKNVWEKTPSREYMDEIQELFEVTTTNEQKNRRTNELLRTFRLCYEGINLGNKFSEQRRWLSKVYEKLPAMNKKREFISKLSRIANFFYYAWYMEESKVPHHIDGLEYNPEEGEFVSLLVRYLRDANSNLSAPILARFYSQALDKQTTVDEFIESAKACVAFFTLWRSANSTSGLPDIYRRYFKGSNTPVKVGGHSWENHPGQISAKDLKQYFLEVLKSNGVTDKEAWITASERFLFYNELKTVCRFVLFVSGHDRIADEESPGLTKEGNKGTCSLLKLSQWVAKDFKSVEHVTPQNPPKENKWDGEIYEDNLIHQLGNLMLLPVDLNKYADNKDWAIKYLYYCHIAEQDKSKLEEFKKAAEKKSIFLSKKATKTLSEVKYNRTAEPILCVGENGTWDAELIKKRTRQIKEITWEVLFSWLQPK